MPARPLCWLTVSFISTIAAYRLVGGYLSAAHPLFPPATVALLSALIILLRRSRPRLYFAVSAVLFAVFGIWAAQSSSPRLPPGLEPFMGQHSLTWVAEVSAPPEYYPDRVRIPLRIRSVLEERSETLLDAGVLLTVSRKNTLNPSVFYLPGDTLLFRTTLRPFRNFNNPGGFDYVRYQAERGFHAQGYLRDERLLVKLAPGFGTSPGLALNPMRRHIELFRQKALAWFRETLEPDAAAFYATLVLGYQHLLDPGWQELISRTGLNHLLSVSGLHLGLVSLLVFQIVRTAIRLFHPAILNRISDKHLAVWPALACAVVYAFLAGFGAPSIWRSVLMLAVCFAASFWYRPADSLTILSLAAMLILILDPNCLWQISFQLTFACVLAIILIYPVFRNIRIGRVHPALGRNTALGWVLSQVEDAFWVSIAVSLLVLPLTIYYFNGFSLAGFAANILLIPFVAFAVLPVGLLSVALFAFSATLAYPVILAGGYLLAPALWLIEWFGGFSWSYFWTGNLPVAWLFFIYALTGFVLLPFSRRLRWGGLASLAVVLGCSVALQGIDKGPNTETLRVDVIDVGQGTSVLVRFPAGETMLVDGGGFPERTFDIGRGVVAPFLWQSGVHRLDHVVLSHDHPDHRNGLQFILSHFETGAFWESGIGEMNFNLGKLPANLRQIALRRNIPIRTFPDLHEDFQIGTARIRVLHPSREHLENLPPGNMNYFSLVLQVSYGDTSLILPGDIGRRVEADLLRSIDTGSQILLVAPHHGSDSSSSEEFLDGLRPVAMVFSSGHDNRYGFPAQTVIKRCAERKIPTFRTDLQGAVHAVSDGRRWKIEVETGREDHANLLFRRYSR